MLRWNLQAVPLAATLAIFAGCNDSTGTGFEPRLSTDTVMAAAPSLPQNADQPTALDLTANGIGGVGGGRYPNRPLDATRWDFAVRIINGSLSLVPARVIGIASTAAISQEITTETYEGLREAPGQSTLSSRDTVALRPGALYVTRSREVAGGLFGSCYQFSKISPISVDQENGRVELQVTNNAQCGDPRFVEE